MCGICGIYAPGQSRGPDELSARASGMVEAMRHRGPNDRGVLAEPGIALGMTRLSIQDLSDAGHQPMTSRDGQVTIVYNGEDFTFVEERRRLEGRGVRFESHSDTEVILNLYLERGESFVDRLRGMYAVAVYDRRPGPGREKLVLARDPLGIKPLLYADTPTGLLFGSELKALLASGLIEREIDRDALLDLLTIGSVYQPATLLRGVRSLLPGHMLVAQGGQTRTSRFWSLDVDRHARLRELPYEELVERTAAALEESVRLHTIADVPVGAFLSGGVDSSFVVGVMSRLAPGRVKTFSVGFEAEGAALDETDEARETAERLGTDHRRVVVRGPDVSDALDDYVSAIDQPTVDGVNSYFVCAAAAEHVKVALSGTGGDEAFAGYPWYALMAQYEASGTFTPRRAAERVAAKLAGSPVAALVPSKMRRAAEKAALYDGFLGKYAAAYHIFGFGGAEPLLAEPPEPMGVLDRVAQLLGPIDELSECSAVDRTTALCVRGYAGNQLMRDIDAVSMAHSLEVRVPLFDTEIMDLALSMPASARLGTPGPKADVANATYRDLGSKRVLIDAGKRLGVLPESIDLQPKRGFVLPMAKWLENDLRDVLEDGLSERSVSERGLFDAGEVRAVRDGFMEGRVHWTRPWLLLLTELWCRRFVDPAPATAGFEHTGIMADS